jgi:ribonuclease R
VDEELTTALRRAEALAQRLRDRRFARGALRVESPEVVFAFDGRGGVERAWRESEPHAHMLVEELMILANECVAGLLAGRRREALYRVHESPKPQSVALLLARLTTSAFRRRPPPR